MDEEDSVDKERRAIIEKYDRGRENGAQIDDWENPEFSIYHTTDRYGFIHNERLQKRNAEEQKRIQLETDREWKWIKMKQKWESYRNGEKLRQRIFKGIPDKFRGPFWAFLLELEPLKIKQKGKYEEMLNASRDYSPDVRQIDLDVNRTYRDHINFRDRFNTSQKSLFNILCAYSVYNSEVGYCQGMSQIAALLLMYLAEEDAFWGLAQLMSSPKYAMHGFFINGFPKLVRFQAHHDKVLRKMIPKLKKHLDKHGVDSGLYTLKWFFQCFLDRVPFELALRLWDIYFMDGERVLIIGAYTILKLHSKQLLARKNMDEIVGYIQSKIPDEFGMESDRVIEYYQEFTRELQNKKLDTAGPVEEKETPTKPFGMPHPSSPPKRNPSLRPSTTASTVGHHLMGSRVSPIRIRVPPPTPPRNRSPTPIAYSASPPRSPPRVRSTSPSSSSSSSPKVRNFSPSNSPPRIQNASPNSPPKFRNSSPSLSRRPISPTIGSTSPAVISSRIQGNASSSSNSLALRVHVTYVQTS